MTAMAHDMIANANELADITHEMTENASEIH
jgi:hypothetical protein